MHCIEKKRKKKGNAMGGPLTGCQCYALHWTDNKTKIHSFFTAEHLLLIRSRHRPDYWTTTTVKINVRSLHCMQPAPLGLITTGLYDDEILIHAGTPKW